MTSHYRVRNWSNYNEALVNRGSGTLWVEAGVLDSWKNTKKTGKRGASKEYSDLAIETLLMLKVVYQLALRQTIGFARSIFKLMDVELKLPHYSTLSRRAATLEVKLSRQPASEPCHLVVDSTGIKVYGEGEWKQRKHGKSKRRTWLKLHLGIDEATGEILAGIVTPNSVGDSEVVGEMLDDIEEDVGQLSGDGAYDRGYIYDYVDERDAVASIPPRKDAKIWFHGNREGPKHQRDENLRRIRQVGRSAWKKEKRFSQVWLSPPFAQRDGDVPYQEVCARKLETQCTELMVECKVLNKMTRLGMPDSYPVEA